MTNHSMHRAIILVGMTVALTGIQFSALAQTAAHRADAGSAQQGEAAIRTLQQQGLYDSLRDAIATARYEIHQDESRKAAYCAANPAQHYDAGFAPDGLSLASERDWRANVRFTQYGYGGRLALAGTPEVAANGNRVEYRRAFEPVTEWYVNQPAGVEQGFQIAYPPGARADGEKLTLVMELTGDLRAEPREASESITLTLANGDHALSYSNLRARDSQGRELPSRMKATETQLILEVDDQGAVYPVTVDPLFSQQARLLGSDGAWPGADHFGYSVAVLGNLLVAGAPDDDGGQGAAYVFARDGANWTLQQKLTPRSPAPLLAAFGRSVSIAWDAIVVGAPNQYGNRGSAYIFENTGSSWNQVAQLLAPDFAAGGLFGFSVSIVNFIDPARIGRVDDLGGTIVIGAPLTNIHGHIAQGSAHVYWRAEDGRWRYGTELTSPDGGAGANFGWSVAVDEIRGTIVAGAPHGGAAGQGVAYVYTGQTWTWSLQSTLTAFDGAAGDEFGHSVSIDWTGARILVGAPFADIGNHVDQGAAYLFVRVPPIWSVVSKLTDGASRDGFGWSVAIREGDVIVGAPYADESGIVDQGRVHLYNCEIVCTSVQVLTSGFGFAGDLFGMSVAIDPSGTIAVGEPWGNWNYRNLIVFNDTGAAYVFVVPPAVARL